MEVERGEIVAARDEADVECVLEEGEELGLGFEDDVCGGGGARPASGAATKVGDEACELEGVSEALFGPEEEGLVVAKFGAVPAGDVEGSGVVGAALAPFVFFEAFEVVALLKVDEGAVDVGFGVVGLELDGFVVRCEGGGEFELVGEDDAGVLVGFGVGGHHLDRGGEAAECFVEAIEGAVGFAEVVEGARRGLELECFGEKLDGELVLIALVGECAEEMVGIGVVGVELEGLLVEGFGFGEVAGAVVGEGLLDELTRVHVGLHERN